MSMLMVFIDKTDAEVLSPPTKIPLAKDIIIEKYAYGQPLKLFRYTGKWEVKEVNKKLSIVGKSAGTPVYLISLDKLSRKPKSFRFDFAIQDRNSEYGFIYGEIGVIIRNNKMNLAAFDSKSNILKVESANGKTIDLVINEKSNTLDITTGYDPTGGVNEICTMYINGIGLSFNCPSVDSHFGVSIGQNNSITINNIRWGIGSK